MAPMPRHHTDYAGGGLSRIPLPLHPFRYSYSFFSFLPSYLFLFLFFFFFLVSPPYTGKFEASPPFSTDRRRRLRDAPAKRETNHRGVCSSLQWPFDFPVTSLYGSTTINSGNDSRRCRQSIFFVYFTRCRRQTKSIVRTMESDVRRLFRNQSGRELPSASLSTSGSARPSHPDVPAGSRFLLIGSDREAGIQ